MKAASLSVLALLSCLQGVSAQVTLTVVPNRSQFFKYESFNVSCKGEEESGLRVMKRTLDGEVGPFPSGSVRVAFPATDSGDYWCESDGGESSQAVNITVTDSSVILEAPALPLTEGDHVTLTCKVSALRHGPAQFFQDDALVAFSPTGNFSLDSVSSRHQGVYRCETMQGEVSPSSWLTVAAARPSATEPPAPAPPVLPLLCHLLVGAPFLLSTILLALVCRERRRARLQQSRPAQRIRRPAASQCEVETTSDPQPVLTTTAT